MQNPNFRPMLRARQAISDEACIQLLREQKRGVLCVLGDDGYPYGMPINHWYCEEDGNLYFHSGPVGHKIDALQRHPKASFCVYDEGYRKPGAWSLNIQSVIVFGTVEFISDHDRAIEICRQLSYKFTQDLEYIEHELAHSGGSVLCFYLHPEHISGKLVNES